MVLLYIFLVVAGMLNAVQAASNSTLHKQLHHPLIPAIISFFVGLVGLLLALLVHAVFSRAPLPTAAQWTSAPWWAWIGGLLGAIYVVGMVNVCEVIGAGVFIGLTVTASVATALLMDHYALLGLRPHQASVPRIVGGVLMILGIVLIGRF